jgi:hypothetical protein
MAMPVTKFLVTFSGKSYPDYRPVSIVIPTQSKDEAKEWARKQLEIWNLDPLCIKVDVVFVEAEAEAEASKKAPKDAPVTEKSTTRSGKDRSKKKKK